MSDPGGERFTAEEILAAFLEEYAEPSAADVEALCSEHAEIADELRPLIKTALELRELLEEQWNIAGILNPAEDGERAGLHRRLRFTEEAGASAFRAVEGETVGDFRLLRLLGRGGMGEVWEAEQLSLSRRVALKLLLPERVDQRGLDFFAREARAGGRLAHPGIVSVFGKGEDDGLHWIAMELVEDACDLRRSMEGLREEEELSDGYYRQVAEFVAEVADALEAAHSASVIHRDLKPGNILVTKDDRPKVLDFGLAKLTDELSISLAGQLVGTYAYMSPEQVAAKHAGIDHRTDVFSLGVVLYEMLTLVRPFDGDTTEQVAHKILWEEPVDPRTIRSRVPRDLAVICGMAMEKDPNRRYSSMVGFAADLRRHLAHELIQATPPTLVQRMGKWMQRNPMKSAVGAVAALAFLLVSVLLADNVEKRSGLAEALNDRTAALELAEEAREAAAEAAEKAKQETSAAREVQEFMVSLFQGSDPSEARGATITAREILDRGAERIDQELEDQPVLRARLQIVMGDVYTSLSLYGSAESLLEQALAARREALGGSHPDTLEAIGALGHLRVLQGRYKDGAALFDEALAACEETGIGDTFFSMKMLMEKARALCKVEQFVEAEEAFLRALELAEGMGEEKLLASGRGGLGLVYWHMKRYEEAESLFEESLAAARKHYGEDDPRTLAALGNFILLYKSTGRGAEAEPLLTELIEMKTRVLGRGHPSTVVSLNNLAYWYQDEERFAEAEALFLECIELTRAKFGADHEKVLFFDVQVGNLYTISHQLEKAEARYQDAIEKTWRIRGKENGVLLHNLADLYRIWGRFEEAEEHQLRAVEFMRQRWGDDGPRTITALSLLGQVYAHWGRLEDAEDHFLEALERSVRVHGAENANTLSILERINACVWPVVDPDGEPGGDVGVALRLARAAAGIARQDAALRDTLAWALLVNGLHDEALVEFEKALVLFPEDGKKEYRELIDRARRMIEENSAAEAPPEDDG